MGSSQRLHSIDSKSLALQMNFFADSCIRTRCNTAAAMLLVWVFVLASGVANACLLETPGHHSGAVKEPAAATVQAPAGFMSHLDATDGQHNDADSTRPSCLKACDDGTKTLPKAYSGVDHPNPGPLALVKTLWAGSMTVVSAPRRADGGAMSIVGPPMRVRFARLAL